MDRRGFLSRIGLGAIVAAIVPAALVRRLSAEPAPRRGPVNVDLRMPSGLAQLERKINRSIAPRGYRVMLRKVEGPQGILVSVTTIDPSGWNHRLVALYSSELRPAAQATYLVRQIKYLTVKAMEALDEARFNGRVRETGPDGEYRWVQIAGWAPGEWVGT